MNRFAKGLVTEANPLAFPPDASVDEVNFDLNRDGTRSRRLGMDFESEGTIRSSGLTSTQMQTYASSTYVWENVGEDASLEFVVVQFGRKLWFFPAGAGPISEELTKTRNVGGKVTVPFSFTSVDGDLVVVNGDGQIYTIAYNNGNFTRSSFRLKVRDQWGIEDVDADGDDLFHDNHISKRVSSLTDEHLYNLRNQSWGLPRDVRIGTTRGAVLDDPLAKVHSGEGYGKYPSNADVMHEWVRPDPENDQQTVRFFTRDFQRNPPFNLPAPRGYFIIDALNRSVARKNEYQKNMEKHPELINDLSGNLPTDKSPGGATAVEEYAGRVFYAGFSGKLNGGDDNSPRMSSYVLFSQLVNKPADMQKCYQEGDPTSPESSDLVATDGGLVRVSGADKIISLIAIGTGLFVIATNGIWRISGGNDIGFAADNFQVDKVADHGPTSADSLVEVEDTMMYWSTDGIYHVKANEVGIWSATSLTQTTVQTFYEEIPTSSKSKAKAVYDQFHRQVRWLYPSGDVTPDINASYPDFPVMTELVLDMNHGAFLPVEIQNKTAGRQPYCLSYATTATRFATDIDNPVIDDTGETQVTVGGLDVVLGETVLTRAEVPTVKYLTVFRGAGVDDINFTFSEYWNPGWVDWGYAFASEDGVDAAAFMVTGSELAGDSSRDKMTPYLTFHMENTEVVPALYSKPGICPPETLIHPFTPPEEIIPDECAYYECDVFSTAITAQAGLLAYWPMYDPSINIAGPVTPFIELNSYSEPLVASNLSPTWTGATSSTDVEGVSIVFDTCTYDNYVYTDWSDGATGQERRFYFDHTNDEAIAWLEANRSIKGGWVSHSSGTPDGNSEGRVVDLSWKGKYQSTINSSYNIIFANAYVYYEYLTDSSISVFCRAQLPNGTEDSTVVLTGLTWPHHFAFEITHSGIESYEPAGSIVGDVFNAATHSLTLSVTVNGEAAGSVTNIWFPTNTKNWVHEDSQWNATSSFVMATRRNGAISDMYLGTADFDQTALDAAAPRNLITYYPGDECFPQGCLPYYCGSFQEAIIAEAATVWPLDDMDFSETVPADGVLRKLGTSPIAQDLVTDSASRGDDWDIAGTNPITTRTISDNIGYCRDYFLYLAEPGAGAWISAVNEHPSNVDINGDTQADIGAYMVREYSTGPSSFLVSEDYFVYTFLGAGDPQRADPLTMTINIDDATGAFTINMDGKNQAGSTAQNLSGGFWVHAKYSRTFGTISGSTLPYDVRCDLYINGVLEGTLDQSTQRANIKNTESYGVAANYAANDVPGFAIPSRLYIANDNIAAADLYTGTNMDMDVLKLGWDRNFTTYVLPDSCYDVGCEPYNCDALETAVVAQADVWNYAGFETSQLAGRDRSGLDHDWSLEGSITTTVSFPATVATDPTCDTGYMAVTESIYHPIEVVPANDVAFAGTELTVGAVGRLPNTAGEDTIPLLSQHRFRDPQQKAVLYYVRSTGQLYINSYDKDLNITRNDVLTTLTMAPTDTWFCVQFYIDYVAKTAKVQLVYDGYDKTEETSIYMTQHPFSAGVACSVWNINDNSFEFDNDTVAAWIVEADSIADGTIADGFRRSFSTYTVPVECN